MNDPKSGLRAPGSGIRRTLDQEIDRVAARMVSVEQDRAMAERIVSRLPEREQRHAWLGVFLPQAAAAVAILVAVVVWTSRDRVGDSNTDVGSAGASAPAAPAPAMPVAVSAPVVAIEEAGAKAPALQTSVSQTPIEPALLDDHERGLDPVAAPIALEVAALEGPSTRVAGPAPLAPLVLTELPLSGESISPH